MLQGSCGSGKVVIETHPFNEGRTARAMSAGRNSHDFCGSADLILETSEIRKILSSRRRKASNVTTILTLQCDGLNLGFFSLISANVIRHTEVNIERYLRTGWPPDPAWGT